MLLEIGREGEAGKPFEWSGDRPLVIGRGRNADMTLSDPLLSRRHCQLELHAGQVVIADLGSANGTFVNGIQSPRTVLLPGDHVTLGKSWLRLVPELKQVRVDVNVDLRAGTNTKRLDVRVAPTQPDRKIPLPEMIEADSFPDIEGYKILATIGKGSFGTVFRAKQQMTGREVAIKVIPSGPQAKQETVARFLREIDATGRLQHPNLVQVFGANEGEHFAYLIMEWIDGGTLAKRIEAHGKLEPARALEIARQIASALEHAFSRGYIHRDVKPENILIDARGIAKLVDFGLVKNLGTSSGQNLTRPGQGFGSLAYMPPEQVRDAATADQRADVYSLGATLYHMVTGRRPFSGQVNKAFLRRVMEEMPDPIPSVEPSVPKDVVRVVERCLQKDPAARFQGPRELRDAIEKALQMIATGPAPALPARPLATASTEPEIPVGALGRGAGARPPSGGDTADVPPHLLPPASGRHASVPAAATPPVPVPVPAPESGRPGRSSRDDADLVDFAMDLAPISTDSSPFLALSPRNPVKGGKAAPKPPGPPPPPAPEPAPPDPPQPPGKLGKAIVFLAALLLGAALATAAPDDGENEPAALLAKAKLVGVPGGWKRIDDHEVAYDRVQAIANRLGARIVKMALQSYETPEGKLQINTMLARTEDEAILLRKSIRESAAANTTVRFGRVVYELISSARGAKLAGVDQLPIPPSARAAALDEMHYPGSPLARWRCEVPCARADVADTAALARLSSTLVSTTGKPPAPVRADVAALKARLGPRALVPGRSWLAPAAEPGERLGIPYVTLAGEVEAPRADHAPPGPEATRATLRWPAQAPQVRSRLAMLPLPEDPAARLEALVTLFPVATLGDATPYRRDAVVDVLQRGAGNPWDRADTFVTLARAAGIPCREIVGWHPGFGPAYWCEAYAPGAGWVGVDVNAPRGGADKLRRVLNDHVPLFFVEDGELPVIFCGPPRIERVPRPAPR